MSWLLSYVTAHWRYIVDVSTFIFCAALFAVYQVRLVRRTRRNPALTVQGMNHQARVAWVHRVMTETRDIMAVQTFRNSTMAATLMASTAVILILGILNMLAGREIGATFRGLDSWAAHEPGMGILKLMILMIDLFIAFFAFSLSVRGYHHAGYLVNVPLDRGNHNVTIEKVVKVLDRTSKYYSIGMRSYYLSVGLVLWLFGPEWLLLSTIGVVVVLNHLDHLPD